MDSTEPYQQGALDGLCGVYAIINALAALCPEIDRELARALFAHLARRVEREVKQPLPVIAYGMNGSSVRLLLSAAQVFVRKRLDIKLEGTRPYRHLANKPLGRLWSELIDTLDGDVVAIMAIGGSTDHWTVACGATENTLRLLDSSRRRVLVRSRCTLKPTSSRVRILAHEVILLSRTEVPEW